MLIRTLPDRCHPGFLLAYLTHPLIKHYIESFNAGGSRRAVTKGHIESFEVPLPPIAEQRAIAHILGTLDDKVELNRRMNETLEAMARATFKSWFVDFDSVRANRAKRNVGWVSPSGRNPPNDADGGLRGCAANPPYELPPHLAGLFPNRFEESELGEIPAGWAVGSFASTVELLGGATPKTSVSEYWGGDIPWFSVVDAPSETDIFVVNTEKTITRAGLENSATRMLTEGTTIISARGTVGRVALVGVPVAMNQSCYGLRGKVGQNGFFTYYAARALVSTLQQRAHGSVFDTITRDTFSR
jgi:type I restriction enzyme S subunit